MSDESLFLLYCCNTAKFRVAKNSLLKYVCYTEEIIHVGNIFEETLHINWAIQLNTTAIFLGIYFQYSRKALVPQQNPSSSDQFINMSYQIIKFWWHKFHKLLTEILQNHEDIYIKRI